MLAGVQSCSKLVVRFSTFRCLAGTAGLASGHSKDPSSSAHPCHCMPNLPNWDMSSILIGCQQYFVSREAFSDVGGTNRRQASYLTSRDLQNAD